MIGLTLGLGIRFGGCSCLGSELGSFASMAIWRLLFRRGAG